MALYNVAERERERKKNQQTSHNMCTHDSQDRLHAYRVTSHIMMTIRAVIYNSHQIQ